MPKNQYLRQVYALVALLSYLDPSTLNHYIPQ